MSQEVKRGQIAYAIYFLPGDTEMKMIAGLAEELSSLSDEGRMKSGFIFAPYEVSATCPKLLISSQAMIAGEACIAHNFDQLGGGVYHMQGSEGSVMAEEDYKQAVEALVQDIKASDTLEKAVLARQMSVSLPQDFSSFELLKRMKEHMPNAFCFLVNTPQAGMWMGATPELLLEHRGQQALTNALAGTLPANSSLEWSDKERVEQQIVSDYVAAQLHEVGVSEYVMSAAETIVSGAVQHLKTSFEFELADYKQIERLIEVLHPTPAVCGMPLEMAKSVIKQYEPASRQYYSGYLGPWGVGNESHLFVNLRSMQISQDHAFLYVGAGITEGSIAEKEWEETEVKAQTLLKVLKED